MASFCVFNRALDSRARDDGYCPRVDTWLASFGCCRRVRDKGVLASAARADGEATLHQPIALCTNCLRAALSARISSDSLSSNKCAAGFGCDRSGAGHG